MRKYYYTDGTNTFGPFTLEELRYHNINKETRIWFQGMQTWTKAKYLPELDLVFMVSPMPRPQPVSSPPKNWLIESILATIFCCIPFGIVAIVYAANVESKWNSGRFQEAESAARNAKTWTVVSFVCGLLYIIPFSIYMIIGLIISMA